LNIQQQLTQEFYVENFKWKITIPENMKTENPEKWKKSNEVGVQMVEDTYNEKVEDNTIPICIFTNGGLNVFEAKYQTYNPEVDGSPSELTKTIYKMIYTTLVTQIPNAVVDTLTTIQKIDNLDFNLLKMDITYQKKKILNISMYSRLFENQMFVFTITYQDEEIGEKMLAAWKNSTFKK
jgi:hypothetical protein